MQTAAQTTRITLKTANKPLEDVLSSLRSQSGYDFVYSANLLDGAKPVTVTLSNASITEAMDKCLTGQPFVYNITGRTITIKAKSITAPVPAQTVSQTSLVTGRIIDEKGGSLPGVTVKTQQGDKVTASDADGRYQINVAPNAVLLFSFIGYEVKTVPVQGRTVIDVALVPKNASLNEVVVIGYGTTKRSDLTASVSSIGKEAMSQRTLLSFADAIKGKAAGVQITQNDGTPGAENTIRIRGASSVSASSTPLYVIDGVLQDDANGVNPGDIESIEILKDASGTAIYGSRGANGVVLITTKAGKAGKPQVELYNNTGVQSPGKLYSLLNASEYIHRQFLAAYQYTPASATNPDVPASTQANYTYYRDTPKGTAGGFWAVPTNSPYATWKNNTSPDSVNTDWQNAMLQRSTVQEYRINLLGGSKDTKYAFLGGYLNQGGLIVFSDYQRYNGRFNFQQNLSPTVIVTANIAGARNNTNGFIPTTSALNGGVVSNPIISAMLQQPPNKNLTFTDVEDNAQEDGFITTNPYSLAKYVTNNRNLTEWITRLGLDWAITPEITFHTTGTMTYTNTNTDAYYPKYVTSGAKYNGRAVLSRGVTNRYLNENLLYYKKQFGKDHQLNAMAGATFEGSKYSLITAENQNYNVETLGVFGLANGTAPIIPNYNITKWAMASFLSRVQYTYKNRYLATVTMRADGSSRFSSSNKWGYFPSAALAWRASEEKFISDIPAISNLKFRTSIGQSGNTAIPSYLTLSTIATYFSPINGNTPSYGVVVDRPENLSLKWETTMQIDGGMDLGLFKDRLTLTVDWYLKKTKDLLIQKVTPGYTGYRNTWTNLGSIQNSGLEVEVNAVAISKTDFTWNIGANIGFNRSKAIEIGSDLSLAPGVVSGIGTSALIQNGQPLGQWYGYKTDGIYQSLAEIRASGLSEINGIAIASVRPGTRRFIDVNGDNKIDANDRTILGQGQPRFNGGLTSSFTYKSISANVVVQYSYGNKVYNANRVILESGRNVNNSTKALATAWTPTLYDMSSGAVVEQGNPSNSYRMPGSPEENLMLSDWIEDGSYMRVSDITLSYQFPGKMMQKLKLRGLALFASGKNLFIWTKYSGYDPEVNTRQGGFGDLMPSLDFAAYPRSRVYSLGIRAQF